MGGEETLNPTLNSITYLTLPSSVIVAAAICNSAHMVWSNVHHLKLAVLSEMMGQ